MLGDRRPAALAAGTSTAVLLAIYVTTAAPGVTYWDSGEFIAAARSWGIPHPPGTPLYVAIARAFSLLLGALGTARAVNLLSVVTTALAGGALALFVTLATGRAAMGLAAALCAGAMSTVWGSATVTEVYATALLLVMGMLLAAERAGATGDARWLALTAYAMALSLPVHLSVLVAAPAAIVLAAQASDGTLRRRDALILLGVAIAVAGVGHASALIDAPEGGPPSVVYTAVGIALLLVAALSKVIRAVHVRRAAITACVALLAVTPCVILMLRAAHDPAVNMVNPTTWSDLWLVIGRRPYGTFTLWPRNAPFWLQAVQFLEYMDWQVALSLAPRAAPAVARTAITLAFIALGAVGCAAHRRAHRRTWRALVTLFLCASAGLVLYLNFRPGYSLGFGIVPQGMEHEVRERDYFFVLAFWTWGAWVGIGAVALASRIDGRLAWAGIAIAALPVALNWRAMDLAHGPERDDARSAARALLWGAPANAVLVSGGDNDTFPLWYLQIVEGARPDVTLVNRWLLATGWNQEQLARRNGLKLDPRAIGPSRVLFPALAAAARRAGRPLAFSISSGADVRDSLGGAWMLRGLTFVAADRRGVALGPGMPLVDTAAAAEFVQEFGVPALPPADAIDDAPRHLREVMGCPAHYLAIARTGFAADSLASSCNH